MVKLFALESGKSEEANASSCARSVQLVGAGRSESVVVGKYPPEAEKTDGGTTKIRPDKRQSSDLLTDGRTGGTMCKRRRKGGCRSQGSQGLKC